MSKFQHKHYLLIVWLFSIACWSCRTEGAVNSPMSYTSNPDLPTIIDTTVWKGTPIDAEGRFSNLYHPFEANFGDVFKWMTSTNPQKQEKKAETRRLQVLQDSVIWKGNSDYMIWLGHATYLLRIEGKVYLTDPVLLDNTFLKRESELPFAISDFPNIDFLLLSHNHRDHCDKGTIKFLAEKNPHMKIITGLGMGSVIHSWLNGHQIQEAGWYQRYTITPASASITYVPSRHWSKRWLRDDNKSLWGGFYIRAGEKTIYFMGDSGAGQHFADIQKYLGSPDYCLMGVGAYKPEWFMSKAHISPSDAIKAFNTLRGKFMIPMHFGTFDLSDEPRMEPLDILVQKRDQIQGILIEPVLGQNLFVHSSENHPNAED